MIKSPAVKVTAFRIHNYKGIRHLDAHVPPAGAVFTGKCDSGKTSGIDAVLAALTGRGIDATKVTHCVPVRKTCPNPDDPSCVCADRGEVLVALDSGYNVRRVIPVDGKSTVSVKHENGDTKGSPAKWLADTFGAVINPIALAGEKDAKRRRAIVQAAVPLTVTLEQLRAVASDLPDTDCSAHALDVIADVRQYYFTRRAAFNVRVKDGRAGVDAARLELDAALAKVSPDALAFEAAEVRVENAKRALAAVAARGAEAEKAITRTAGTRAKVDGLRAKAADARVQIIKIDPAEYERADQEFSAAQARTVELHAALAAAEEDERRTRMIVLAIERDQTENDRWTTEAAKHDAQATELESAIAGASVEPVTAAEFEAANAAVIAATEQSAMAARRRDAEALRGKVAALEPALAKTEAEALRLDGIVGALTNDLPRRLSAEQGGIPGVTFAGDSILLDGTPLDDLCGMQRIRFCATVAMRAAQSGRVLVVDELEKLDTESYGDFVAFVNAAGFQLLGTRVESGDVRVELLESVEAVDPAWSAK